MSLPRIALTLLVAPLVLACSDPRGPAGDPPPPVEHRLQARQWTVAGGQPLAVAIFDRERRQDCQFRLATDGKLRCLPVTEDVVPNGQCADPACQQPLYRRQGIGACVEVTGDYVTVMHPPAVCPGEVTYEVRRLMPAPAGTRTVHWDGTDAGPAEPGALVVVETTPPQSWVEGRESAGTGARLSVRVVESADGARFAVGLFDARWGGPCTLQTDGRGELRCWPAQATTAGNPEGAFADADCKVPLAVPLGPGCQPPLVVPAMAGLSAVGPRWTEKVYEFRGHGPCREIANDRPVYQVGAPLGPDALVTVGVAIEGQGRLRGKVLRDDSGRSFSPPLDAIGVLEQPFVDGGADCLPVRTSTGLRCLTTSACDGYTSPFFGDAGCTRRLARCGRPERPAVGYRSWPTCHATAAESVRPADGAASGVYAGTPGACTKLPAGADGSLLLGAALEGDAEAAFWAPFAEIAEDLAAASR